MEKRHLTTDSLRAAWWALRAVRVARRQLASGGLENLAVPAPPPLEPSAARGVGAVLRRTDARCLVSAAVWQEWHRAQGSLRDLVIGVTAPGQGFAAHAWLEGQPQGGDFVELSRRPARS